MDFTLLFLWLATSHALLTTSQDIGVRCVPPLDFRYRAVKGGRITAECFGLGDPNPLTTWTRVKTLETYEQNISSVTVELDEVSFELYMCTARSPKGIERCYVTAYFESYERLYAIIQQYLSTDNTYNFTAVDYDSVKCILGFESFDFVARESEILLSLLIVYKENTTDEINLTNFLRIFYEFLCVIDGNFANFAIYNPFFGDNIYQSGLIISELVSTIFTEEEERYNELLTYLFTSLLHLENNMNISYGEKDRRSLTQFAVDSGIYTTPVASSTITTPTIPTGEVIHNISRLIQGIENMSMIDEGSIYNTTKQFENIIYEIDEELAQDMTLTDKILELAGDILEAIQTINTTENYDSNPLVLPPSLLLTISNLETFIDKKIQGYQEGPTGTSAPGIIKFTLQYVNIDDVMFPLVIPNTTAVDNPVASIPVSALKQIANENNVSGFYVSAITYDINLLFADGAQTTRFLSLNFHVPIQAKFESAVNITFSHGLGDVTGAQCISFSSEDINTSGLELVSYDSVAIVCSSDHVTTFAAIVSFGREMDRREYLAQKIVSFILVGSSFLAISISLILFCLSGKTFFHNLPNLIYFNYAVALLFGCCTFLFLLPTAVLNERYCMVAAFITQYAWISVFAWSLCISSVLVYFFRVQKVHVRNIKPLFCYFIFGWGTPVIPCVVTFLSTAPDYHNYVSYESANLDATCFLSSFSPRYTTWGLLGPVLILLLLNIIVLAYLSIYLCCRLKQVGSGDFRTKFQNLYFGFLVMITILGLPWIFLLVNVVCNYFIKIDPLSSVMEWLFLILNAPIGVVFFFAYTIKTKEVRNLFSQNIFTREEESSQLPSSPSRHYAELPSSLPRARRRFAMASKSSSEIEISTAACYDNPLFSSTDL